MSTESAAKIYDAESWQDARRPDPLPERLRYEAAAIARDEIGKRMREWFGARSGLEYERLMAQWVDATTASDRAYEAMIEAELQARKSDSDRRPGPRPDDLCGDAGSPEPRAATE